MIKQTRQQNQLLEITNYWTNVNTPHTQPIWVITCTNEIKVIIWICKRKEKNLSIFANKSLKHNQRLRVCTCEIVLVLKNNNIKIQEFFASDVILFKCVLWLASGCTWSASSRVMSEVLTVLTASKF